jgi:hypothetical protein
MVVVPLDRFEAHGEIPHSADAQRLKLTVSIQGFCASRICQVHAHMLLISYPVQESFDSVMLAVLCKLQLQCCDHSYSPLTLSFRDSMTAVLCFWTDCCVQ